MWLYIFFIKALSNVYTYQLSPAKTPQKILTLLDNEFFFRSRKISFDANKSQEIKTQHVYDNYYTIKFPNGKYLCRSQDSKNTIKPCNEEDHGKLWNIEKTPHNDYVIKVSDMCLTVVNSYEAVNGLELSKCTSSQDQRFIFNENIKDKISKYDDTIEIINNIEKAAVNCNFCDSESVKKKESDLETKKPEPPIQPEKVEIAPEKETVLDVIKECPDLIWEIRSENKIMQLAI